MPHALGPGKLYRRERRGNRPVYVLDYVDAQGRRRRQPLSTDRSAAEQIRNKLISERDLAAAGLGAVAGQSMPLAKLVQVYLDDLATHTSERHVVNVRSSLTRTLAELGVVRVRDLRPLAALQYRASLVKSGLANRTANLSVDRLHAALEWGVRTSVIAENPIRNIQRLPDGAAHQVCRRRSLTDLEIARFLDAAAADDREQASRLAAERTIATGTQGKNYALTERPLRVPQAPMWRAFLETGSRYGELISVTWADIDLDAATMRLRAETTKAGHERVIPLLDGLVAELRALRASHAQVLGREASPRDRVFATPECKSWSRSSNNAMRVFDRLLAKANIDRVDSNGRKLDIHALRGSCASALARHGVGIAITQRLLGHADPKLTMRHYVDLGVDDVRDAIETAAGVGKPRKPRLVRPEPAQGDEHIEASA